ncbi:MAG: sigma-70 family RNA polymerase sigma factor [Planctomycetota bacterium]
MQRSDSFDHDGEATAALIEDIRRGDESTWRSLVDRFEGRLLAYARRRLGDQAASEDVVQETFVGFLVSLPNYDPSRNLESYLFSICAHKLTDHLRRSGRRPTLPLAGRGSSDGTNRSWLAGRGRPASSIARSGERHELEERVIAEAVAEQIQRWQKTSNWDKLKTIELAFVAGRTNQEIARRLRLTEQQVANYKSDFLTRLKAIVRRQSLDASVFPELAADESKT